MRVYLTLSVPDDLMDEYEDIEELADDIECEIGLSVLDIRLEE